MVNISHRWSKDSQGWAIICEVVDAPFRPGVKVFSRNGRCPFCNNNAKEELSQRKRAHEEQRRDNQAREALEELRQIREKSKIKERPLNHFF